MAPDQGEYVDGWPSRFRSPRHWSRVMNGTGPMYFKMWACMFSVASKHQAIEEWLTTALSPYTTGAHTALFRSSLLEFQQECTGVPHLLLVLQKYIHA